LVPAGAVAKTMVEPTSKDKNSFWYNNDPPDKLQSTRIEVASPTGQVERRFLHAITVANAGEKSPRPAHFTGEGVEGTAVGDQAYVFPIARPFSAPAPLSYRAPQSATRHVIVGLAPDGHYHLEGARDGNTCKVSLTPGEGAVASNAGTLAIDERACAPSIAAR